MHVWVIECDHGSGWHVVEMHELLSVTEEEIEVWRQIDTFASYRIRKYVPETP